MKRHFGKWLTAAALAVGCTVMTANAFAEDRQKALDAGMTGYLTKPLDSAAMLQTLAQVCAKHGQSAALPLQSEQNMVQ